MNLKGGNGLNAALMYLRDVRSLSSHLINLLNLHQRIIKRRAAAHIRQGLRSQLIDIRLAGRKLVPPD